MLEKDDVTTGDETEDNLEGCDCSSIDDAEQTPDEDLPAAVGGGA